MWAKEIAATLQAFLDEEGNEKPVDENGKVRGRFKATGVRPRFTSRLASHGIQLSPQLFDFEMEV